jgi:integrase/recombinase XerD
LPQIGPAVVVGKYIRKELVGSKPTKKFHLSALRQFFDRLGLRHAMALNPAVSVRAPKYAVVEGKTPALSVAQARQLLASIDTTTVIGLRDRAIIATLIYTAARMGAVAKLRRKDYYPDGN